jgi:hypothetical protein
VSRELSGVDVDVGVVVAVVVVDDVVAVVVVVDRFGHC